MAHGDVSVMEPQGKRPTCPSGEAYGAVGLDGSHSKSCRFFLRGLELRSFDRHKNGRVRRSGLDSAKDFMPSPLPFLKTYGPDVACGVSELTSFVNEDLLMRHLAYNLLMQIISALGSTLTKLHWKLGEFNAKCVRAVLASAWKSRRPWRSRENCGVASGG